MVSLFLLLGPQLPILSSQSDCVIINHILSFLSSSPSNGFPSHPLKTKVLVMNYEACAVWLSVTSLTLLILLSALSSVPAPQASLCPHHKNSHLSLWTCCAVRILSKHLCGPASSLLSHVCSNSTLFSQTYLKLQPLSQRSQTPLLLFSLEHLILHNSLYILFLLVLPISTAMQLQGQRFLFSVPWEFRMPPDK